MKTETRRLKTAILSHIKIEFDPPLETGVFKEDDIGKFAIELLKSTFAKTNPDGKVDVFVSDIKIYSDNYGASIDTHKDPEPLKNWGEGK